MLQDGCAAAPMARAAYARLDERIFVSKAMLVMDFEDLRIKGNLIETV